MEMAFLVPYLQMRETECNIADNSRTSVDDDDEEPLHEELVEDDPPHPKVTTQQADKQNARSRRAATPAQEMVKIMKQNSIDRKMRSEARTENQLDEVDMF